MVLLAMVAVSVCRFSVCMQNCIWMCQMVWYGVLRERKKERGAQTKSMNTHKKRMRADKKSERKQHTSRLQLNPVSMNADGHTFISVFGMQIELKLRLWNTVARSTKKYHKLLLQFGWCLVRKYTLWMQKSHSGLSWSMFRLEFRSSFCCCCKHRRHHHRWPCIWLVLLLCCYWIAVRSFKWIHLLNTMPQ